MSLPPAYAAALASPNAVLDLWLEIEGFPVAFGMNDRAGSWFGARDPRYRRTAIRGSLLAVPAGIAQEARPLEGESSIGSYSLSLLDNEEGELLTLLASTQRRDGWVRLSADLPADGAARDVVVTGDPSAFPT